MTRGVAVPLVAVLLLAGQVSPSSAQRPNAMADPGTPAAAVLDGLVQPEEPGLAALVRQGGRVVFQRGYGVRQQGSRARIDERTGFRLASVTKQLTATAVMLLVRDGRLRYDDRLTTVLAFPAWGGQITIRHLLNHTSGLPDYEDLMDAAERAGATPWTADRQIQDEEVLSLLRAAPAGRFPPGTSWAYCNSGYVVLGLVVARVSGQRFCDFLHDRVFAPLRMNRTLAYEKGRNQVPDRAFGHSRRADGFVETDQSPTSATLGDGGVYSNLEDLGRWDQALRDHALVSPAAMKPALTPAALADGSSPRWPQGPAGGDDLAPGQPVSYGFGWFLDPWHTRARQWHHGETVGFRNVIERFPADDLTVVVLCNRDDLEPRSIAERIAARYLALAR
ncbi:MAG TPA: serine hydrolase domain-containing protein [Vicinamibacteria bacterium]|nr:serine hydrolase domain-containing protein [Vicinamibacteria bacterium]